MIKNFSEFCQSMFWIYIFLAITAGIIYSLLKTCGSIKKKLLNKWDTLIKSGSRNKKNKSDQEYKNDD